MPYFDIIFIYVCLERNMARLFADDTTLSATTGLYTDEVQTKLIYDLVNVYQAII
jgi:hypothetical protein